MLLVEAFSEQTPHGPARFRGVLGDLDHGPVARRQRGDQRTQRQVHGVIPRYDDADHAKRLMEDLGRCRLVELADAAPLGLHPLAHLARGVTRRHDAWQDVADQGFLPGARTEISVHGRFEVFLMLDDRRLEPMDVRDSLVR